MPKKGQTMRFTDVELSLIKGLFADNETLLYALRKSLLGFVLTDAESATIKGLSKDAFALIRKAFLPSIDPAAPLFQLTDMSMGLNVEIKGMSETDAYPLIKAKALEIQYITERLDALEGVGTDKIISLQKLGDTVTGASVARADSDVFINITARNYLLSYIDSNISQLMFLSSMLDGETHEETSARLKKNSSK